MMKKLLVCFIFLFFALLTLSACREAPGDTTSSVSFDSSAYSRPDYMKDPDNIDPATALKLREDFLQYLIILDGRADEWKFEEIWIQKYFGNYNGCEVVYMGSNLGISAAEHDVEIAEYTFNFPTYQEAFAYKDSKFYSIKKAYYMGFITKENVYEIGQKINPNTFLNNNPDPNVPSVPDTGTLEPVIIQQMRQSFLELLLKKYDGIKLGIDDIWVNRFLGKFGSCEIVLMDANMIEFSSSIRSYEIEGYIFELQGGQLDPYVYKNSKFYTIKEAFDAGLISKANVYDIGKQVGKGFIEKYPNP